MTQAFNLSQLANFVNSSGKLSDSGIVNPAVPSGTVSLFVQTSAPTGWTKSTAHNDKALRVVSGTAGSGGTTGFTSALGTPAVGGSVSATTLSTSQMPSHNHSGAAVGSSSFGPYPGTNSSALWFSSSLTGNTGGGGSHTHSLSGATATINVAYVDVIIATKN